jgi:hypothetical protein
LLSEVRRSTDWSLRATAGEALLFERAAEARGAPPGAPSAVPSMVAGGDF